MSPLPARHRQAMELFFSVRELLSQVPVIQLPGKNDKVLVCHRGNEICIAKSGVKAHLAHGCTLGACSADCLTSRADKVEVNLPGSNEINIYPNPSSSQTTITFSLNKPGKYTLELFDLNGILVSRLQEGISVGKQLVTHRFNAKKYSSGMYFVRLASSDYTSIKRIIIR